MKQMKFPCYTVAFNFYMEANERRDVVSVTLPEIDLRPAPQLAGLELTVYFVSIDRAAKALENRDWQSLEIQLAEENMVLLDADFNCNALLHTAVARPKRLGIGNVCVEEPPLPFVRYEVRNYKIVRDGENVLEIDTAAQICTIGGRDFGEEVFKNK